MSFLAKLKGDGAPLPPQPSVKSAAPAWIGSFLATSSVSLVIITVALIYNNATRSAACPRYW